MSTAAPGTPVAVTAHGSTKSATDVFNASSTDAAVSAHSTGRVHSLTVHSSSHSADELILNPELFSDLVPGELVQIYDVDKSSPALRPQQRLVLRVPLLQSSPSTTRLELSVQRPLADALGLKQFHRVAVERVASEDEVALDFVELSFRRQYLQRGNMLRFKHALLQRTVYVNQNITINSMQAQIQDLRKDSSFVSSGVITEKTKFVFRSKSARIIWLVQISAEMWDVDEQGEMYFEKFLKEFVSPILDSWKSLGVSHMLTVIFFARTFYFDRVSLSTHPDLFNKKSFKFHDGYHQQDFFKIVIENIDVIDKVQQIKKLRQEFWSFAQSVGWRVPSTASATTTTTTNSGIDAGESLKPRGLVETDRVFAPHKSSSLSLSLSTSSSSSLTCAVPSDAIHGNLLEAINTSLNILERHYMDRDLQRTGNSIVLVSAGSGVFQVQPYLSQITKQRMLDSAFGIDFISLSRPPVHSVPLFLVDCSAEGGKDFYEIPHWIRVSFVDCKPKTSVVTDGESTDLIPKPVLATASESEHWEYVWTKEFAPQASSAFLGSQIMYLDNLRTLVASYTAALPFALRRLLLHLSNGTGDDVIAVSRASSPVPPTQFLVRARSEERVALTRSLSQGPQSGVEDSGPGTGSVCGVGLSPTTRNASEDRVDSADSAVSVSVSLSVSEPGTVTVTALCAPLRSWGQSPLSVDAADAAMATIAASRRLAAQQSSRSSILLRDVLSLKIAASCAAASAAAASATANKSGDAACAANKTHAHTHGHKLLAEVLEAIPLLRRDHHESASVAGSTGSAELSYNGSEESRAGASSFVSRSLGSAFGSFQEDASLLSAGLAHLQAMESATRSGGMAVRRERGELGERERERERREKPLIHVESGAATHIAGRSALTHALSLSANNASSLSPSLSSSAASRGMESVLERQRLRAELSQGGVVTRDRLVELMCAHDAVAASSFSRGGGRAPKQVVSLHDLSAAYHSNDDLLGAAQDKEREREGEEREDEMREKAVDEKVIGREDEKLAISVPIPSASALSLKANAEFAGRAGAAPMPIVSAMKRDRRSDLARMALAQQPRVTIVSPAPSPFAERDRDSRDREGERPQKEPFSVERERAARESETGSAATAAAPADASPQSSAAANKRNKISFKNFIARNQTVRTPLNPGAARSLQGRRDAPQNFVIAHGKIIPVPVADPHKKKTEENIEYLRAYAKQSSINPFRVKDGEKYLNSVTHNRRRWSHVFPEGKLDRLVDYGLNWKSLTQPAILPLYTDYLPSIKDLENNYSMLQYSISIDRYESPFLSLEDALRELVCQRLSQEFQLSENFDKAAYFRFNRFQSTAGGKNSEQDAYYILTMGHRIHFLLADVENSMIHVTQYISKKSQMSEIEQKENIESDRSMFQYRYEMWLPQSTRFQTMTQTFYQFPVPEFLWNKVDNIMMSSIAYDGLDEGKKPRSLKYLIIPHDVRDEASLDEYYAKIDLLVEFLNKYAVSKDAQDALHIVKDRTLLPDQRSSAHSVTDSDKSSEKSAHHCYHSCSKAFNVFKCNMRGPRHANPNWLYIKHDAVIYPFRAFHFFIHWFVCDSWLVDEFCNLLFRRCTKWGLRLSHIPGYFAMQNLNVHPFRPLPYVSVPAMSVSVPAVHCTPVRLVERVFFSREQGWIFDSERNTDWLKIGLPLPNYADRDRDLLADETTVAPSPSPSFSISPAASTSSKLTTSLSSLSKSFQRSTSSSLGNGGSTTVSGTSAAATSSNALGFLKKGQHRRDRQYTSRLGISTVRMGASGFLWLPSVGAKVSDVNMPLEERSELATKQLRALERFVVSAVDVYEILLEVIDGAFAALDAKENAKNEEDKDEDGVFAESEANGESPRDARTATGNGDVVGCD